ncbi:hypothetical protein GCM10007385_44600 [Tateyamaria omphalii]|uniref:WcbI family polysaccharide biosynthesis putative acetyltransferase n=1 Tax=Tateyamaria omphalii TaxID=299262 RepID=UPI0019A9F7B5|nr:WcbI family polysaccharide biosynthesis putative acetyltransferase [Tateyamaria omphalii]GGX70622.1 hypothetical protein GCM10007385_44600 [Tateyamaria omphalii]
MKALVIGNCQARPLTQLVARATDAQMLEPIVLHLAKDGDQDVHAARMAEADIIFAQQTAENFARPWLRSNVVRANHPFVFVWPNIFWAGQQPFLRYMTHTTGGRMMGPLEALHDVRIYHDWLAQEGLITDRQSEFDSAYVARIREMSLAELQRREATCDVAITDVLGSYVDNRRLFFTFNHPTAFVLAKVASRLLKVSGFSSTQVEEPPDEPLGRYVVPSLWPDKPDHMQGDGYTLESGGQVSRRPGPPVRYNDQKLLAAFHEVYSHNPLFRDLSNIRFTPANGMDADIFKANGAPV